MEAHRWKTTLAQPQQASQLEPELGTAQPQLVFIYKLIPHSLIYILSTKICFRGWINNRVVKFMCWMASAWGRICIKIVMGVFIVLILSCYKFAYDYRYTICLFKFIISNNVIFKPISKETKSYRQKQIWKWTRIPKLEENPRT